MTGGREIHLLLDVFRTAMGSTFERAIPVAISHSPPVSIGAVNQDVLVVFLKRQVLVSRRQEILQSNDNPLRICVYLEDSFNITNNVPELYEFKGNNLFFLLFFRETNFLDIQPYC